MQKVSQNVALASGVAVTAAQYVARTFFHTSLTPDALSGIPLAVGAVPHIVTSTEEFIKARRADKVARIAAAKAASDRALAAAKAAADAAAAKAKSDFAATIEGAINVALQDKAVPADVVPVVRAVATAVAEAVHSPSVPTPAQTSNTVGVVAP